MALPSSHAPNRLPIRTKTATVVVDRDVLGGMPVVAQTRVPAATIVAYLRAGRSEEYIRTDYPTLPRDGVRAVEAWAARTYGPDWLTAERLQG